MRGRCITREFEPPLKLKRSLWLFPKPTTVEKEIVFIPVDELAALIEGDYILSLEGAFIDSGERLRKFS